MSTVISSIIISGITEGYTSEYIANVLWKQGLAQVSRITMLPYLEHDSNTICFTAYADIQAWADTEAAFNFIKRLDKTFVARIVHHDDDAWHVRLNTRYNANDNVHLFAYATNFNTQYYLQPLEQTATQELEDIDLELEQDMQDLLYDIEEHERLTEDEYEQLFQHFGQDDDEEYLEDDLQEDTRCIDEYLQDSHMMRLQDLQDSEQPDYDYIQNILDRIDNNRLSTMEQGLRLYTLF